MTRRRIACLIIGAMAFGLVSGCTTHPSSHDVSHMNPSQTQQKSITMQMVLDLWNTGQVDEAVDTYIQASNTDNPDDLVAFGMMSEQAFGKLPASERNILLTQWLDTSSQLRALSREVIRRGQEASQSTRQGDPSRYYDAVERVGQAYDRPGRVLLAQLVGQSLVKNAQSAHNSNR